ncbi:unnamed protein product, partial [Pylaiella littoralis]
AEHELCFETCSTGETGGLFSSWRKHPAAGTCNFVCAIVREGCMSCTHKRKVHALKQSQGPKQFLLACFRSPGLVKDILRIVIDWCQALAWTTAKWLLALAKSFNNAHSLLLCFIACLTVKQV